MSLPGAGVFFFSKATLLYTGELQLANAPRGSHNNPLLDSGDFWQIIRNPL